MAALSIVPNSSLGDRVAEVRAIAEALELLSDSDISPVERDELAAVLIDRIAGTREKVDACNAALAEFEAAAAAAEREAIRLKLRQEYFERQAERLGEYCLAVMSASKLKTLQGHTSTLSARLNPVKVLIADENLIPREYFRVPPPPPSPAAVPDKKLIKAMLETGAAVDGCTLCRTSRLVRS